MAQVFEQIFGRFKSNQITIATDGDAYLLKIPALPAGRGAGAMTLSGGRLTAASDGGADGSCALARVTSASTRQAASPWTSVGCLEAVERLRDERYDEGAVLAVAHLATNRDGQVATRVIWQ